MNVLCVCGLYWFYDPPNQNYCTFCGEAVDQRYTGALCGEDMLFGVEEHD